MPQIESMWRQMRRTWIASFFVAVAILAINFSHASASGAPLPWNEVALAAALVLFGTLIVGVARRWFNAIAGCEICRWRSRA